MFYPNYKIMCVSAIKAHIIERIRERPFQSKYFYLRRLSISHHVYLKIIKDMIKENLLVEKHGRECEPYRISNYPPKKNIKYLLIKSEMKKVKQ